MNLGEELTDIEENENQIIGITNYQAISKKILSLLGISQKAGYIASGEFLTEKSVKEKKSYLVIVASDSSGNTKKMFENMCSYYGVPIYYFSTKNELGHAMGKEFRASLSINDAGMAGAIKKQLKCIVNNDF